ncbi:tetratricopeptide repeat protein [endosymbiont of Ridgeia piscesae]|jgi:tetratricopeptide (TPR) repeat protein|uniref:Tetratricopeptide repeat n=1 Tax=endosymbiont of Ridgeia piscesae TaxID=54398 RepID=A0A0T5ZA43_9GAMM|nr:tetratricopeptide repeat protein [endosymbiont of Ridgeia piscesae]KRT55749.1 Tetratricopeptide repeat [endosymbiont of Ridgeia piscesae]KRT59722.1 Tetratricopeptide repeat-containing protein [endosymbiont of Ridgeia piscesae]
MIKLLLLPLLLIAFASDAFAKEPPPAQLASRLTYEYLFLVEALMRHQRYDEAALELEGLLQRVAGNGYETALVHQSFGYVEIGRERYPSAIRHFRAAVNSAQLPAEVSHQLSYTLVQLLFQEDDAAAALQLLIRWMKSEAKPPPRVYLLKAQIHRALDQIEAAIDDLETAIRLSDDPAESWFQLLIGLYLDAKKTKQAVALLSKMIVRFPATAAYWRQLAGLQMELGRERDALATLELAHSRDQLKQREILWLAQLYLHQKMPQLAAQLLATGEAEQDQKALELLAQAWVLAREPEKALPVFDALAKRDQSGRWELRGAEQLVELERWDEAAERLQRAVKQLKRPSYDNWVLLGAVYIRLNKFPEAQAAFTRAEPLAKGEPQRKQLAEWLGYLEHQLQR